MIAWLQSIWDSISNFFSQIGDIIEVVIEKLNEFVSIVSSVIQFIGSIISWVPPIYMIFFGISVVILIIYIVLGREPGGD